MGKLYRYQPTLGMDQAERTQEGYGAVIVAWLHSVEDMLSAHFLTVFDDFGVTLTPLAQNISGKQISIEVSGANLSIGYTTGNQSPKWRSTSVNLNLDPWLFIAEDTDMISFGCGALPVAVAVCDGRYYDGTECGVLVGSLSSELDWFIGNGVRSDYFSSAYGRDCSGKSSTFCVKTFTFYKDGITNNHIMYLDGGIGLPSTGQIYTIGDDTYIQLVQAFALRV